MYTLRALFCAVVTDILKSRPRSGEGHGGHLLRVWRVCSACPRAPRLDAHRVLRDISSHSETNTSRPLSRDAEQRLHTRGKETNIDPIQPDLTSQSPSPPPASPAIAKSCPTRPAPAPRAPQLRAKDRRPLSSNPHPSVGGRRQTDDARFSKRSDVGHGTGPATPRRAARCWFSDACAPRPRIHTGQTANAGEFPVT